MHSPILSRERFYARTREGHFRDLDFNLVQTSIGAMVEPRQVRLVDGGAWNSDIEEYSFDRQSEADPATLAGVLGTFGEIQALEFVNYQP